MLDTPIAATTTLLTAELMLCLRHIAKTRQALPARCSPLPIPTRQLAYSVGQVRHFNWTERLPTIIRPSFWATLYPGVARWLKERKHKKTEEKKKEKPWNPATFYIWMFILIGSQSINMIVLENEWTVFSRKADGKIALLKEVIEKVQRGEEVDVEKALGTGDDVQEQEWKEVLQEIETEDRLWKNKERKKQRRAAKRAEKMAAEREAERERVFREIEHAKSSEETKDSV